jgi:hypothetical protein
MTRSRFSWPVFWATIGVGLMLKAACAKAQDIVEIPYAIQEINLTIPATVPTVNTFRLTTMPSITSNPVGGATTGDVDITLAWTTPTDDFALVGSGTDFESKALPNCPGANDALYYLTATNAFGCRAISVTGTSTLGGDTLWAAKGDSVWGTANDTAQIETAGANGSMCCKYDSAQTRGVIKVTAATTAEISDVTVGSAESAGTATATTYAPPDHKHQLVQSTNKLLGRTTAATGLTEEIGVGAGLTFSALSLGRAALTGDVTASADSNTTTIANDAVTYAKLQNVAGQSVVGKTGSGSGDAAAITAGAAGDLLGMPSSTVGFNAPSAYNIPTVLCRQAGTSAVSSASEVVVVACQIPALGTTGLFHVIHHGYMIYNNNAADTLRLKWKYGCTNGTDSTGCTNVWDSGAQVPFGSISGSAMAWNFDFYVYADGSTSAQIAGGNYCGGFRGGTITNSIGSIIASGNMECKALIQTGALAIDASSATYFQFTAQWSASASTNVYHASRGYVEVLP